MQITSGLDLNEPKNKRTRITRKTSDSSLSKFPARNNRVLPLDCIICQKDRWQKKSNGVRGKVRLVTCETDSKKLIEVAENFQDEIFLYCI